MALFLNSQNFSFFKLEKCSFTFRDPPTHISSLNEIIIIYSGDENKFWKKMKFQNPSFFKIRGDTSLPQVVDDDNGNDDDNDDDDGNNDNNDNDDDNDDNNNNDINDDIYIAMVKVATTTTTKRTTATTTTTTGSCCSTSITIKETGVTAKTPAATRS